MRQLRAVIPWLALGLAACASSTANVPAAAPSSATGTLDAAVATITAADVQRRVAYLASDELRGRDTPGPGLETAARYIAEQFRAFGLQPAGDSGTFIQRFPYRDVRVDRAALRFETRARGATMRHEFGRDFFLIPAAVDSVAGTPLFAGSARPNMTPPEGARGRILFFLVPDTALMVWQQNSAVALQTSFGAGAAGVVLVLDPQFPDSTIRVIAEQVGGQTLPFPAIGMRYDAAKAVFAQAGMDLDALRTAAPAAPASLEGVSVLIRAATATVDVPNVVAVLPGSDSMLRAEYVVFSAHMDHVGVGAPDATGDSIYNGADDDASGTAAVIEIAEAFAALGRRPARSVMFLLVSGEEKGLLGSMYFVQHPPVPTEHIVANINIDMIGRNAPDTVVAIGQDFSSLGPSVQAVAAAHRELGLTVAPDLWPEEQLFYRSDHFSFAAAEVPAIFFTTGLHEDYHKPSDEVERINQDKLSRVARLLFRFGHTVADTRARPQWTPEGLTEVRRRTNR